MLARLQKGPLHKTPPIWPFSDVESGDGDWNMWSVGGVWLFESGVSSWIEVIPPNVNRDMNLTRP